MMKHVQTYLPNILRLLIVAGFLGTKVQSHGVQVRHCLNGGNLRVFVEHWHGDLTSVTQPGTMTIDDGTTQTNLFPTNFTNNVNILAGELLPGCAGMDVLDTICPRGNTENDWVYYDFSVSCGVPHTYTLLAGQTVYLTEGCGNLYPAVVADTSVDSPPALLLDDFNGNIVDICSTQHTMYKPCGSQQVNFGLTPVDDCDPNPLLGFVTHTSGDIFLEGTTTLVCAHIIDNMSNQNICCFNIDIPICAQVPDPSEDPTAAPSAKPSPEPSAKPSPEPSAKPSSKPSAKPSSKPSPEPSAKPSLEPSAKPSSKPSSQPSTVPSCSSSPTSTPTTSMGKGKKTENGPTIGCPDPDDTASGGVETPSPTAKGGMAGKRLRA